MPSCLNDERKRPSRHRAGRLDRQADVATFHPQLPGVVGHTGKARKDSSMRRGSRAGCAQGAVARGPTPRKHLSSQPRPETILVMTVEKSSTSRETPHRSSTVWEDRRSTAV
ncbi:hypothetical protein TIFTF001_023256 [Ficus carica]|uniref:Uncharacterized protein n=1 Tax=Ficus carica TaxID=3494 RepID=A0AA88AWP5_FICCA|nr:hypothetical protein TIFTF001_023256 [Ficus carica]